MRVKNHIEKALAITVVLRASVIMIYVAPLMFNITNGLIENIDEFLRTY